MKFYFDILISLWTSLLFSSCFGIHHNFRKHLCLCRMFSVLLCGPLFYWALLPPGGRGLDEKGLLNSSTFKHLQKLHREIKQKFVAAFALTFFCFLDVVATMQEPVVKVTGLQESGLTMWWTWCFHWPHEPCVCMTTPPCTLLSLKNFIFLCLNLSVLWFLFPYSSAWFEFALSELFCSTMPLYNDSLSPCRWARVWVWHHFPDSHRR